jgi:hypothetical protein
LYQATKRSRDSGLWQTLRTATTRSRAFSISPPRLAASRYAISSAASTAALSLPSLPKLSQVTAGLRRMISSASASLVTRGSVSRARSAWTCSRRARLAGDEITSSIMGRRS